MRKFQIEFTFKDDRVRRHGSARLKHSNEREAEEMLLKAMSMTVENAVVERFLEIGDNQPDSAFPTHHARIQIGIGAGGTCTSQIAKHILLDGQNPEP